MALRGVGPFLRKNRDPELDALDCIDVDCGQGHGGIAAGGFRQSDQVLRPSSAAPQVGLETFHDPLGLEQLDNLGGWLTTVVGRVCLDMLRTRRSRREDYVGTWLPEPIVTEDDSSDPANEYLSDGLTEELIHRLSKLPGFSVPSPTASYYNAPANPFVQTLGLAGLLYGGMR